MRKGELPGATLGRRCVCLEVETSEAAASAVIAANVPIVKKRKAIRGLPLATTSPVGETNPVQKSLTLI
jgi:hypothetical protein